MQRAPMPWVASLESLLYQGQSPLYSELRAIYTDYLAGDLQARNRLAHAIQHHSGILTDVVQSDYAGYDINVWFTPIDVNHLLRDPALQSLSGERFDLSPVMGLLQGGKGGTTTKGKVTGIFTKLPATIYLSRGMLDGMFDASELAAMTLHEVGHVYGYFDTLGLTVATSVALGETQRLLKSETDSQTRAHALARTVKLLQINNLDVSTLAEPSQEGVYELVVIRSVVEKLTADLGNVHAFNGEVEFLADSYASRMGAAAPLASGYLKMARASGHLHVRGRKEYVIAEACKLGFLVAAAVLPSSAAVGALLSGLICAASVNSDDGPLNRNNPIERLEAMHGDLVGILKDRGIPAEYREQVLSDANFISGLRENLVERRTVLQALWSTLIPAKRKLYKQIQFEREMGKLVNNPLFVKAAELRQVSTVI